jgi:hypothetical protein
MRILVIGGTGGFGSIISSELLKDGHEVIAAGRSEKKGVDFVEKTPGMYFSRIDRDSITAANLFGYDIVVDASGPFQNQTLCVPLAAIEAGVDYLDISDNRDYVVRVKSLDKQARQQGVRLITGVSSTPALSGAIARELSEDMTRVDLVEIAISASSQAAFGKSVLTSMLSGAGRPIQRNDGTCGIAMTGMKRIKFSRGQYNVMKRDVLEVDSPDHNELPILLRGIPSVRFHAGGELSVHNKAMRAISWLVERDLIKSGKVFLGLAGIARKLTSDYGDGRSAMQVKVTGESHGKRLTRTWNLIAEANMGPRIPCLAVPALIVGLQDKQIMPGAMSAANLLSSREILVRMPDRSIISRIEEEPFISLYERCMPDLRWTKAAVRTLHKAPLPAIFQGQADVRQGQGLMARIICKIFNFPKSGKDVPVKVLIEPCGNGEKWTRTFGSKSFSSEMRPRVDGVSEKFGPFAFDFFLECKSGCLHMVPKCWHFLGMRMPRFLMPDGIAVEKGEDGQFLFDVPIRTRFTGLIVHYKGSLSLS